MEKSPGGTWAPDKPGAHLFTAPRPIVNLFIFLLEKYRLVDLWKLLGCFFSQTKWGTGDNSIDFSRDLFALRVLVSRYFCHFWAAWSPIFCQPLIRLFTVSDTVKWKMVSRLYAQKYPPVLLCTLAALSWTWGPVTASRSCSETRHVYAEKGYSTNTAPLTQISGKTGYSK